MRPRDSAEQRVAGRGAAERARRGSRTPVLIAGLSVGLTTLMTCGFAP